MVSRSVIAVVAVVIIIVAVGAYYMYARPSAGPTTSPTKPPQVLDGQKLYTDNCAACHGAKGVGGTAKALTASNADRTKIEKGNVDKGMPAFGDKLTPDEITAILEYLKS